MAYFSRWNPLANHWTPFGLLRALEHKLGQEAHGELAFRIAQVVIKAHGQTQRPFKLCRRGLSKRPELANASEWALRKAIKLLEIIGFAVREPTFLIWQTRPDGKRWKRGIVFNIGGEFLGFILRANSWWRRQKLEALPNEETLPLEDKAPTGKAEKNHPCIWEELEPTPLLDPEQQPGPRPLPAPEMIPAPAEEPQVDPVTGERPFSERIMANLQAMVGSAFAKDLEAEREREALRAKTIAEIGEEAFNAIPDAQGGEP